MNTKLKTHTFSSLKSYNAAAECMDDMDLAFYVLNLLGQTCGI